MNNAIENLNLKTWNDELKKWVLSNTDIKKGIYLIHFNSPTQIYEVRNPSKKPHKKHVIEKNEIVLKPGKFIGGFTNRIFGSSGYARYWKYAHEHQGDTRSYSNCFENSATIYLIADLSDFVENEFIELVEVFTKLSLKKNGVERQEKTNSEYYRFKGKIEDLANEISLVRSRVSTFIKLNKKDTKIEEK